MEHEATIIERWGAKWKTARERAQPIMAGIIPNDCNEANYAEEVKKLGEEMVGDELKDDDFEMGGVDA